MWATRLDPRCKLYSLRLKGDSAQHHIKVMTKLLDALLDALLIAGETISEEDRVVYLLASLPETYNVLVMALEAHADVPKLEVVTKCILHQERKLNNRSGARSNGKGTLTSCRFSRGKPKVSATTVENWGTLKIL